MHRNAAASSEFVGQVYESGTSSTGIYYGTGELCLTFLRARINSEGISDEEFWRWASQLVRGVVDMHRANIIHGALVVRQNARAGS